MSLFAMLELQPRGDLSYALFISRYAFGQPINYYEKAIELNYMGTVNTLFNVVPSMIQRNKVALLHHQFTCRVKYISWGVRAACLATPDMLLMPRVSMQ